MRLTRRAHNTLSLIGVVMFAATAVGKKVSAPDADTLVLDLTKPVPREEQLTALPGGEGGGGAYVRPRGRTLALTVELQSISPQPVKPGEKFTVEVLLRNTGDSAFLLPSSQNSVRVLKQGNKGRRSFLFFLIFEDPTNGRQTSHVMASTEASDTVPSSWLRVEPRQAVRVLCAADSHPFVDWFKKDVKEIRVRAQVSEWKYEDKRYFIESSSEPVLSSNILVLELAPPN